MARIVIEPRSPLELGLLEAEYEGLVADLEAEGHSVSIQPELREYRSVEAALAQAAYVVVVYLADHVDDVVLEAIALAVLRRLGARRCRPKRPRRAAIIGADGRTVLRTVDLPEQADEEP